VIPEPYASVLKACWHAGAFAAVIDGAGRTGLLDRPDRETIDDRQMMGLRGLIQRALDADLLREIICRGALEDRMAWTEVSRRAPGTLAGAAWVMLVLAVCDRASAQAVAVSSSKPVSERTGEVGCWIVAHQPLSRLARAEVFWHLDTYPSRRAAAEAAKRPRGVVVEARVRYGCSRSKGSGGARPA
jgi:hypothetical protein